MTAKDGRGVAWRKLMTMTAAAAAGTILLPAASALFPAGAAWASEAATGPAQPVIVEYGSSPASTAQFVDSVLPPGLARHVLSGLPAVAVSLPQHWVDVLRADGASVTPDQGVSFQGVGTASATACPSFDTYSAPSGNFVQDSGADRLAAAGDTGRGTTVAVLDTGVDGALPDFAGRLVGGIDLTGGGSPFTDEYGHGTFVAGLIAGDGASSGGAYPGEAPGADLVSIKVAGADGRTTLSRVVQGIAWAIAERQKYGIDVLNLSLGATPTGPTVTEPLDQAVEAAWRAGITVVTSAGNAGPSSGTVLSPGDDPLAITVGAYADNNSPSPANWYACPFSSVGPTAYDGWLKPDLVAPGRSVVSLLDPGSTVAQANPGSVIGTGNFVGSGTSFSTGITSGAAALVVAANPGITPDQVKGRLLGEALPSETQAPLIEGHGFLNAYSAATGPSLSWHSSPAVQAEWRDLWVQPSLASSWAASTWAPASWTGSAWTGSAWTGSAWTGAAWNGAAWNGAAWNGSAWTGSAWTGSAWTGSAWTGSAWTTGAWDGTMWNGSAWTGAAWNGSAWTGSAWTGSAWTGSAWTSWPWTGSAWTGSAWTGSEWNGSAWTGSAWTGSAWTGSEWNGSAWTGSAWTGSAWTGANWT